LEQARPLARECQRYEFYPQRESAGNVEAIHCYEPGPPERASSARFRPLSDGQRAEIAGSVGCGSYSSIASTLPADGLLGSNS
ncbi:MAG: hypothetical protein QOH20_2743, partial [Mycobacterium sp.]|nr:hypothetical protein [Mycobacterium sp.]